MRVPLLFIQVSNKHLGRFEGRVRLALMMGPLLPHEAREQKLFLFRIDLYFTFFRVALLMIDNIDQSTLHLVAKLHQAG